MPLSLCRHDFHDAGAGDLDVTGDISTAGANLFSSGSALLNMAYTAAGRYDGFWERRLNSWDIAAGLLLIKEAGGLSCSVYEGGKSMDDGSVIASNEQVFDQFVKLVRND